MLFNIRLGRFARNEWTSTNYFVDSYLLASPPLIEIIGFYDFSVSDSLNPSLILKGGQGGTYPFQQM